MKRKNVFEIIEERRGNINGHYDLATSDAILINEKYNSKLEAIGEAFIYGYEMGCRATTKGKHKELTQKEKPCTAPTVTGQP